MSAQLLMGNEAIALAALHSGINLACGYPGTPSTEIIETIARHNPGDVHVEWSVNEKVALELAIGASYAGMRALVTMKQRRLLERVTRRATASWPLARRVQMTAEARVQGTAPAMRSPTARSV